MQHAESSGGLIEGLFSDFGALFDEQRRGPVKKRLAGLVVLPLLFTLWYGGSIYFNIYNKQVLKVFAYPLTCTVIYMFLGSCMGALAWGVGLMKRPKGVTGKQIRAFLPVAALHTLGYVFTMMSLGQVAVSFTHTIKALEPFFSVVLTYLVMGRGASMPMIASLVPIVVGVSVASATEVSFNWLGFVTAISANLAGTARNVYSKTMLGDARGQLDSMNLFTIVTFLSFVILAPFALLIERVPFQPSAVAALGDFSLTGIPFMLLMAGLWLQAFQQTSYEILNRVTPVTHSVGNCVKRVAVIVASVLFFRNPVSWTNGVGTAVALAGVFAYSQIRLREGLAEKAAAKAKAVELAAEAHEAVDAKGLHVAHPADEHADASGEGSPGVNGESSPAVEVVAEVK